jgi:hypothetical protein
MPAFTSTRLNLARMNLAPVNLAPLNLVRVAVLAAGVATASLAAHAADPVRPDTVAGRFTMYPADGGFLRLDTQTGQMSTCQKSGSSWACSSLPDERENYEKDVSALKQENSELKSAVKRLEDLAGVNGDKRKEATAPRATLPTEEDVDKAMSYVQRMLKKFKEKIKEFEDTDKKGTHL